MEDKEIILSAKTLIEGADTDKHLIKRNVAKILNDLTNEGINFGDMGIILEQCIYSLNQLTPSKVQKVI